MLYSRTLSFIHSMYNTLYLLIPNSQSIPLPRQPQVLLSSFFKKKFILFLAALGLRCCMRAFSSSGERGLLFIAECRLLIAVASLVEEHGL